MDFSYYFVLSLHIIIPSAILFVIIYYSWRLKLYIQEKFQQFKRKVDGYDQLNQENHFPKKKLSFRTIYNNGQGRHVNRNDQFRNHDDDFMDNFDEDLMDEEDEKAESEKMTKETLITVRTNRYSDYIHVDAETFQEANITFLDFDQDGKCFKIFEEKGLDYFTKWFQEQIRKYTFRNSIYVSLESIDEKIESLKKMLENPFATRLLKEEYLLGYAYFLELKEIERQGSLRWEKKDVTEQNYLKINRTVSN